MHITRIASEPNRGDANLRFVHRSLINTSRVQHRLRGPLRLRLGDVAGDHVKAIVLGQRGVTPLR